MAEVPAVCSLVLAIMLISGCGVSGACDTLALQTCVFQLSLYGQRVDDGVVTFSREDLDSMCQRFTEISACVRRATSTCPMTPSSSSSSSSSPSLSSIEKEAPSFQQAYQPESFHGNHLTPPEEKKRLWSGIQDSFDFICHKAKYEYLANVKCITSVPVVTVMKICNKTFHMERQFAHDDVRHCEVAKTFLKCLERRIAERCNAESGSLVSTMVSKFKAPAMEIMHQCKLASNRLESCPPIFLLIIIFNTVTSRTFS